MHEACEVSIKIMIVLRGQSEIYFVDSPWLQLQLFKAIIGGSFSSGRRNGFVSSWLERERDRCTTSTTTATTSWRRRRWPWSHYFFVALLAVALLHCSCSLCTRRHACMLRGGVLSIFFNFKF